MKNSKTVAKKRIFKKQVLKKIGLAFCFFPILCKNKKT